MNKHIVEVKETVPSFDSIIREVQLNDIYRDANFQVRQKLDPRTVNRYAAVYRSGNTMPPVKLAKISGTPVLVDGWHRIAALEQIGRATVKAEITETTQEEARWMAAQANMEHGLPLKMTEMRKVFRAYVQAGRHKATKRRLKSYRDMADELGGIRSYNTIRNWMRKDFPRIASLRGQDEPFRGQGGLPERTLEHGCVESVRNALNTIVAAFRGIEEPTERGRLIKETESVLLEMKEGGPWVTPTERDVPDF
jgi:hypothetical protein